MIKDATLERIWEARRRIYERCGHDPVKLVEHYLNSQTEQTPEILLPQNKRVEIKSQERYILE